MKPQLRRTYSLLSGLIALTVYPALYVVASRFSPRHEILVSNGITLSLSVFVAMAAIRLCQVESDRKTSLAYLNWTLLFLSNPILFLACLFFEKQLLSWDAFAGVYQYQYESAIYFFLLPLSVVYGALIVVARKARTSTIYLITFMVVGALWLPTFAPYFSDPRYLYSTQDVIDYKIIAEALEKLGRTGNHKPSVEEISQNTSLHVFDNRGTLTEMHGDLRMKRISELLPFLEGDNHIPLIYRPLNNARFQMSLLSIAAIVLYLLYTYRYDPPVPAYFDKLMMLMLLYSMVEAIHFYAYSDVISKTTFVATYEVGQLLSSVIMLLILAMFYLRYQFVSSVEGRYYELSMRKNHRKITRWRDVFDNWMIRQFIKDRDLSGRFLLRGDSENIESTTEDEDKTN